MNRLFRIRAILALLVLALPITKTGHCELIAFEFTGTVTSVSVSPDYQTYDFPDVSDPFTGFYTFDSNAPDAANLPDQGGFTTVLSGPALRATVGEFQFEGRAVSISTFQNAYGAGDWIPSVELTSHPALAQLLDHNNFSLLIIKQNLFSDPNVLPLTPPLLAGADEASLTMELDDGDDLSPFPEVSIIATLESLTLVPEPSSALLMVIVLTFSLQIRYREHNYKKGNTNGIQPSLRTHAIPQVTENAIRSLRYFIGWVGNFSDGKAIFATDFDRK